MTDERRLATVLFADVTGSTALGESLDPENLRALLSRYYAIAKNVVAAHGALPFAARARCEAAIIRRDERELEIGLTYLESIRDARQGGCYLRADREAAAGKESI